MYNVGESSTRVTVDAVDELALTPLYEGDRGSSVVQLQTKLAALGFYSGELAGEFDTATKQALQSFQTQYELSEDGFFGPQTWYALTFWSEETEWPLSSPLDAMQQILSQISELAFGQSAPLFAPCAQKEVVPGQLLFWPPFAKNKRREVA